MTTHYIDQCADLNRQHTDAQKLTKLLNEIRLIRDNQKHDDVRRLLNASCDRLDVAISKLFNPSLEPR
jgi:hypothetical protein